MGDRFTKVRFSQGGISVLHFLLPTERVRQSVKSSMGHSLWMVTTCEAPFSRMEDASPLGDTAIWSPLFLGRQTQPPPLNPLHSKLTCVLYGISASDLSNQYSVLALSLFEFQQK